VSAEVHHGVMRAWISREVHRRSTTRRNALSWVQRVNAADVAGCPTAWVRLWFRAPWIDPHAAVWMWQHGGWDRASYRGPGDLSGDREPRRPEPRHPASILRLDLASDELGRGYSAHRQAV